MRKVAVLVLVILCASFLFPGCARMTITTGKCIDTVEGVQVGKTTRQDVLDRFGPPQVIDDVACSAAIGENHLGYEERNSKGWYVSILGLFGFLGKQEQSNTAVFLFDDEGTLVDFAQGNAQTGKSRAWAILGGIYTGMIIK